MIAIIAANNCGDHSSTRQAQCRLDGVCHPRQISLWSDYESIDDCFDIVPLRFGQLDLFFKVAHLTINPDTNEPTGASGVKDAQMFALHVDYVGGQHHESRAFRLTHYGVHYLLDRLAGYRSAAVGAVRTTCPSEQESQIVVYLRDGADGGAWVPGDALLVD